MRGTLAPDMMTGRSYWCRKRFLTRPSVGGLCPQSLPVLDGEAPRRRSSVQQRSAAGAGCQLGQVPACAAPLPGPGSLSPVAGRWPSGYDGGLEALVGRWPHSRGTTLVPTVPKVLQAALR